MTRRRFTAMLLATAALMGPAVTFPASAAAEGTSAVVVNNRDNSDVYRLMLQIRRAVGDVVDTSNVAAAVASCSYCQTIAVSLQGVLLMSDPSIFVPENLALAMNVDCTMCQTLASAYQTFVQTGGPARLTPEGSQEVADIRRQLEAIRTSGMTLEQIQATVDELNARLQQVLATQVVSAGPPVDSPTQTTPSNEAAPAPSGGGTTTAPAGTTTTPADTGTTSTPTDTGTGTTTSTTTTDTGTTTTTPTSTDTTTTPTTTTATATTTTETTTTATP